MAVLTVLRSIVVGPYFETLEMRRPDIRRSGKNNGNPAGNKLDLAHANLSALVRTALNRGTHYYI